VVPKKKFTVEDQIGRELAVLAFDLAQKIAQSRHLHTFKVWLEPVFSPLCTNPVPSKLKQLEYREMPRNITRPPTIARPRIRPRTTLSSLSR